jgi:hypothetical protein
MKLVCVLIAISVASRVSAGVTPASLLGNVGYTKVDCVGNDFGDRAAGEDIYGPFEAGFSSQQENILSKLGCASGKGYLDGGIDTATAATIVAKDCVGDTGTLLAGLLDQCGGHTSEYHFHEPQPELCCGAGFDSASGHSAIFGEAMDGKNIYGYYESEGTLPNLDACGGHWGYTPDSPNAMSYHYHMQSKAPFTIGCYGPNDDGSVVTLAQCRAAYGSDCTADPATYSVQSGTVWPKTATGTTQYRVWCPCFDAMGSNVGTVPLPCEADPTAAGCITPGSAAADVAVETTPPVEADPMEKVEQETASANPMEKMMSGMSGMSGKDIQQGLEDEREKIYGSGMRLSGSGMRMGEDKPERGPRMSGSGMKPPQGGSGGMGGSGQGGSSGSSGGRPQQGGPPTSRGIDGEESPSAPSTAQSMTSGVAALATSLATTLLLGAIAMYNM